MIVNFKDRTTEDVYNGIISKESRKIPNNIHQAVRRKLDMINTAITINDLRVPPGNRLEALKGDLAGFFSIRINDQYRVVFSFKESNAFNVQIVDYH